MTDGRQWQMGKVEVTDGIKSQACMLARTCCTSWVPHGGEDPQLQNNSHLQPEQPNAAPRGVALHSMLSNIMKSVDDKAGIQSSPSLSLSCVELNCSALELL